MKESHSAGNDGREDSWKRQESVFLRTAFASLCVLEVAIVHPFTSWKLAGGSTVPAPYIGRPAVIINGTRIFAIHGSSGLKAVFSTTCRLARLRPPFVVSSLCFDQAPQGLSAAVPVSPPVLANYSPSMARNRAASPRSRERAIHGTYHARKGIVNARRNARGAVFTVRENDMRPFRFGPRQGQR